jgi:NAD(P)-dependent dehydrogenase (short-subunit alcohol dehydrogenase family)
MSLQEIFSLAGKTAIVTGASRGIGRGIATVLGEAGAQVVLAARGVENLEAVRAQIEAAGGQALVVPTDVSEPNAQAQLVQRTLDTYGKIDVLVNNAAARRWSLTGLAHEMDYDNFETTLKVNVLAPFQLTQLVGRHMIERDQGGAIVNIVSIASWMGIPRLGAYSASKAALMRWSESTAVEWGPYGIRVNNVGPGFIQTDETRATWDDPEQLAQITGVTPLGRIGQPEDIGHACLFLASDASAFVTGQTLYVEGGLAPIRMSTGYKREAQSD